MSFDQVAALDLGSTSIKAGIMDASKQLKHIVSAPSPELRITGNRYENDALDYLHTANRLLLELQQNHGSDLHLGMCCQRSSFLVWDKMTGSPVTPLISWQDTRAESTCLDLTQQADRIFELTGLPLVPYYLAPKLSLMLQEQKNLRQGLELGKLLAGTLDCFLIWHWTEGQAYQMDASMAARTLLMDIHTSQWSPELCRLFNVPLQILPKITDSIGLNLELNNQFILTSSLADQSAAVLSCLSTESKRALVNLGTGGFVICFAPDKQEASTQGYLKTLVYRNNPDQIHMAHEGTINSLTDALKSYPYRQCKVDNLGQIEHIFCSPEPNGIGAPYFYPCNGSIFSESIDQLNPEQIAILLVEGIIFRVVQMLQDFHKQADIDGVYLSGGLSNLPCIQQGISMCCQLDVFVLHQQESSLYGAALASSNHIHAIEQQINKIEPSTSNHRLIEKYKHWLEWFKALIH